MTYTQQINRTLTIGDITVTLSEITDKAGLIGVEYSYAIDRPGVDAMDVLPFGSSGITRSDGSVVNSHFGDVVDDTTDIAYFDLTDDYPGVEEGLDIQVGWHVVPVPEVRGSTEIELGQEYASAVNAGDNEFKIPLQTRLLAGGGEYRITELLVRRGAWFTLLIVPVNEAAQKIEIGTTGINLIDNLGNAYPIEGVGTSGIEPPDSLVIESQQFDFLGAIALEATSLTLTVRGGGEIVGPFVFDNIALVSEDIPPVTPVPPGGVGPGDPIPTPPNADN